MENNQEINTNNQYKNLDIELENAINLANESMQTFGERILYVYNLARQKGFSPFESRTIVETRIINVSPQYVRRILPPEAKHIEKRHLYLKHDEKLVSHNNPIVEERTQIKTVVVGEEQEPFWVNFSVKIGYGDPITFELLIDPIRHKVLESKRRR